MEKYEILYILPGKHTEKELESLSKKVKKILTSHGGDVSEEHYMGRRKLAYPIKHVRQGHYYLILFSAEEEAISKLNATLLLTTELLRHLIIKRDPYIMGVPKLIEDDPIVRKDKERDRGPRRRPFPERKPEFASADKGKKIDDQEKSDKKDSESEDKKEKITIEDLDKKLDKILTDDIL